ncbi:hypothetical protein QIH96_12945 [Bradyrhizobium japonicum]|uniref:hypothetical protein n=1 Tax=Bradyrhizobium japonicum TaxID=375 RepID=UPI0027152017|nr:hypothetical protein [Bradyrhizobium japonicum]WLB66007.1 hypothetical protein QIH96_12945 [Bradyrhizobium japonicum]
MPRHLQNKLDDLRDPLTRRASSESWISTWCPCRSTKSTTRAEVDHSVDIGLPQLRAEAERKAPRRLFDEALDYIPRLQWHPKTE